MSLLRRSRLFPPWGALCFDVAGLPGCRGSAPAARQRFSARSDEKRCRAPFILPKLEGSSEPTEQSMIVPVQEQL